MIIPVPVKGKQKSADICKAFASAAPKDAFGYVFYGVNETNIRGWHTARKSGQPWYYIDNSFFDSVRGQQYRIARNRIQTLVTDDSQTDGKRFAALGLEIKPWTINANGHFVLVEQSPPFMRDIAEEPNWLAEHKAWCERSARKVVIRRWAPDKLALQVTLQRDLEGAWSLVTHTSAAAVTAALAGTPVIVSKMSALANMQCSPDPAQDERLRHMQVLADNQFTLKEIREGAAWNALGRTS
jgi:hypothetical protein